MKSPKEQLLELKRTLAQRIEPLQQAIRLIDESLERIEAQAKATAELQALDLPGSALLGEVANQMTKQALAAVEPQTGKRGHRRAKAEKPTFKLAPRAARILRSALVGTPAQTLEEALAKTYGDNWCQNLLTVIRGHKNTLQTTLGQDVDAGEKSFIRLIVRRAVAALRSCHKTEEEAPPHVRRLFD
ncbi:MAG: hypothetical protein V2B18_12295, partial [Pseudomonadota bacterium]